MRLFSRKKGALELSINAIVIIVLAMTLLGLGLTFIRGQIGNIAGISTEVQQQVREQITGQLRVSGEKVSLPRDIAINKNERKILTLGVQNVGGATLYFKINLDWDIENSDFTDESGPDIFDLRWPKDCLQLPPSESEVYGINVRAPRVPGTFALRAEIESYTDNTCSTPDADPIYSSKLSFITIG